MSETPSKAVLRLQSSIKQLQILKGSATAGELAQSFALDIETHELALAEITSLRAQLDEARAKLKRKKEASAQIEKTATEAWHLIAALPYSSAAGELEEKLRALLSESKT